MELLLLQQMGAAASLWLWARRPAHMKAYAFVFTKTHSANRQRTSSPLANRESENFYFTFAVGARPPLLLECLCPARNPPSAPQIFPCPLALFPSFSHFFLFLPCLLTNQLENKKFKEKTL
jgi:hypothetical protein